MMSVFDVNDLGMISGITFSLLLIGYWFSVKRERSTLEIALAAIGNLRGPREAYEILSASQLLNVPYRLRETMHGRRSSDQGDSAYAPNFVEKYAAKTLVMPPALIQLAIAVNDQQTAHLASPMSASATSVALMIEGVFVLIVFLLTAACMYESWEMRREWEAAWRRLYAETKPVQDSGPTAGDVT